MRRSSSRRWRGIAHAWLALGLGLAAVSLDATAGPTGEPEPELRELLRRAIASSDSFNDRYEAEVWLVDMSARLKRYMPDERQRLAFLRVLHGEAARANVPPELALAVIEGESRFDRFAISSAGAQGYMQIMPFWLAQIAGPEENLFHRTSSSARSRSAGIAADREPETS